MEIDKFTPCLEDAKTGEIVPTTYSPINKEDLPKLGNWLFNWRGKDLKGSEIYKLSVKGSHEIEGLIALTKDEKNKAVYVQLVESAPHNKGTDKKYNGVGGHLFAIAMQKSLDAGYGGFIFLDAKNMELVEHYKRMLHAQYIGGRGRAYRMVVDEESAQKVLQQYTMKENIDE